MKAITRWKPKTLPPIMLCTTAGFVAAIALTAWPYYQEAEAASLPMAGAASEVQPGQGWAFPTYEVVHNTEVIWQAPASGAPRGVLFVAHGCNHGAVDFWPSSGRCPTCTGLPEELRISQTAIARGYVVVAISSQDRESHRCWHPHPMSPMSEGLDDTGQVKRVLTSLTSRQGWQGLPLYALGASSGGSFVLHLTTHMALAGVCSQIMAVDPRVLLRHQEAYTQKQVAHPLPPTMFVHMPRDARTAKRVAADIEALQSLDVPYLEQKVDPRPLTPTWMFDRCSPRITLEQSTAIYQALQKGGLLDEQGFLAEDPRRLSWATLLSAATSGVPNVSDVRMQPDLSDIGEELNLLHASHEIVSDTTDQMLDFFESHLKPPVRQQDLTRPIRQHGC